jgi:hypothetical protein
LIAEHSAEIFDFVSKGVFTPPTLLTYKEENEQRRIADLRSMGLRFMLFYFYLYQFKNPAFAEEREWRLISYLAPGKGEDAAKATSAMEFRALKDRLIPFWRIALETLNQPSITEIVLGPKNITPESVMQSLLQRHGWNNVKVRRSSSSYRG